MNAWFEQIERKGSSTSVQAGRVPHEGPFGLGNLRGKSQEPEKAGVDLFPALPVIYSAAKDSGVGGYDSGLRNDRSEVRARGVDPRRPVDQKVEAEVQHGFHRR